MGMAAPFDQMAEIFPAAPAVRREAEEDLTQGAQFEISIDGKPRSHRERREVAIEAAEFLKRKFPNCDIVVKDLQSGEVTAVAYKANTGPR